jgi:hypothetical protein
MSVAKLSPDQIRGMIADVKARHSAPKWPSIVPSDAQNSHLAELAWPVMHEAAYYGLAGEVVRSIEPHSEADPVAILLQFLVASGNAVGLSAYYQVEGDKHRAKLFVVTSGATSKGRKGTALGRIRQSWRSPTPIGSATISRPASRRARA